MEEIIFDIKEILSSFFNKKDVVKKILYLIIFYIVAFLTLSMSNYVVGKNVLDFSNFDLGVLIIIPAPLTMIAYYVIQD